MTLVALYVFIYLIVSLPSVQDTLRSKAEGLLYETLEVPLTISRIEFSPFNRIELFNVTIPDQQGDTLLFAKKIGVGIALDELILHKRICLYNIQLFGLDANIYRETTSSETNLQFIIDAFTPQEKREPRPIDLRINSALIRRSKLSYNVTSEPYLAPQSFDANHINIEDISATINIRAFNKDTINAHIKRLSCREQSGLAIKRLSLQVQANRDHATLSNFALQLPNTSITPQIKVDYSQVYSSASIPDSAIIALDIDDSYITLSDIAALVPSLQHFDTPLFLSCHMQGCINDFSASDIRVALGADEAIELYTSISAQNILRKDSTHIECNPIRLHSQKHGATILGTNLNLQNDNIMKILSKTGDINLNSRISGSLSSLIAHASLYSGLGDLQADATISCDSTLSYLKGKIFLASDGIDLSTILGKESIADMIAFSADIMGEMQNGQLRNGRIDGQIDRLDFNNYSYSDIALKALANNGKYKGKLSISDPNGEINLSGEAENTHRNTSAHIDLSCKELDLAALNLLPQAAGNKLSFNLDARLAGKHIDTTDGEIYVDNLHYGNSTENFTLKDITIEATHSSQPNQLSIKSDYLNGDIEGTYTISTLPKTFGNIIARLLPSLVPAHKETEKSELTTYNNFDWHFNITPHIKMAQILKLPFTLTDTAQIDGFFIDSIQQAQLNILAPNVWIGLTHLEDLSVNLKHQDNQLDANAFTNLLNAKKEATSWAMAGVAKDDNVGITIDWDNNRLPKYNGKIKLDTRLSRNETNKSLAIDVDIRPTQFAINDTIWDIKPASILVEDKNIAVNHIDISRPGQHLYINGVVSQNAQDTLHVDLQDINLDYIFKTLNIDFVTFGGNASGRVDVANLYGEDPYICTRKLDINDFSYNQTVLGDLSVLSMLDLSDMGILIKGIINNHNNQESYVDGYIYPTQDSISIAFDVERIPLKFIRPFINTILIDAEGEASGHIVLEGNFERIYIYGDAFAHSFSFGVPFINTRYHLSDSIHFTPDKIFFDNITVYDEYDNTAKGRGVIKHKYFTQTQYDIEIYDANNMLVFDVPRTNAIPYYGTIFGSGNVSVKGNDYNTNINVDMTSNRNSNFTFALTNTTNAVDYPFLTFSNKREQDTIIVDTHISEIDSFVMHNNMLMEKKKQLPTIQNVLNLSLNANITPDAEITLLMNEMTGDKLEGYGDGILRLEFNTADNEILMFGSIDIDKGNYDFSIEDIITRDFKIQEGSSVSFHGNPLDATLDINAIYNLQANLADLDESFTSDSELTRTIVPVNTILLINGPLTTPDINFDIELPTLSADMESRMRSIISTDEMMTRQIIYLLALNRFYTSENNSNQSTYNELGAMAASTLSSSIGALMGQISENWNIAPKVRSDRGDFSDLEVDLFLSSQLLNNRLIFNGNFGYRDSRYSSTNFIGDFDIEYLLTENGNLRLKGYNHFNDRNYTMRTALTTQGIGLVYKHDFNTWKNFFEFSKQKLFIEEEEDYEEYEEYEEEEYIPEQPTDTVLTIMPDILE
ncbi:MAG: translocation/assembly module TamB domain-containing protein [Bacteroidaceae bacterium]|nr:translocation/assembly module TamB domain-containing protein [Bacteroidaceae bacterium]